MECVAVRIQARLQIVGLSNFRAEEGVGVAVEVRRKIDRARGYGCRRISRCWWSEAAGPSAIRTNADASLVQPADQSVGGFTTKLYDLGCSERARVSKGTANLSTINEQLEVTTAADKGDV